MWVASRSAIAAAAPTLRPSGTTRATAVERIVNASRLAFAVVWIAVAEAGLVVDQERPAARSIRGKLVSEQAVVK